MSLLWLSLYVIARPPDRFLLRLSPLLSTGRWGRLSRAIKYRPDPILPHFDMATTDPLHRRAKPDF